MIKRAPKDRICGFLTLWCLQVTPDARPKGGQVYLERLDAADVSVASVRGAENGESRQGLSSCSEISFRSGCVK